MAKTNGKYQALQARLDYQFDNPGLLDLALRHSSFGPTDNQRLEFLGDRVLGLTIADALYREFPNMTEGELAPRFNYLIRKESCARVAEALNLGDELYLGRSEAKSGGRRKTALLGDVMEAVIAAIYLDGGFDAAQNFVLSQWKDMIHEMPEDTVDAKTRLQEYLQARKKEPPSYKIIKRDGPDHAPVFTVECLAAPHRSEGEGKSKRAAEQDAAAKMLESLEAGS